jgi:hypothetical protein
VAGGEGGEGEKDDKDQKDQKGEAATQRTVAHGAGILEVDARTFRRHSCDDRVSGADRRSRLLRRAICSQTHVRRRLRHRLRCGQTPSPGCSKSANGSPPAGLEAALPFETKEAQPSLTSIT